MMNDKQKFNSEFKELILRCEKALQEASTRKKFWYYYNCDEYNKENEEHIYISLETEKGKKIIAFYCWFWIDGQKDYDYQIEAREKNPNIKIEDAPLKKCIVITEGDWHKPNYYDKDLNKLHSSDFFSYEKKILEKKYFLKEKNEAATFFLNHLKKILNEDI